MTPYYQDDYVTLYHGDCRELLPSIEADVVVTDPPYGIGWSQHPGRSGIKALPSIVGDGDVSLRDEALRLLADLPAAVFGSFRAPPPTDVRHVAIYQKALPGGLVGSKTGFWRDVEPIYLVGPWPVRAVHRSSVITSKIALPVASSGHPHAKPVDVIAVLIGAAPLGTILDPFVGSGTTLVAAKSLNRKAIGIEIEERYCEVAANRLSQEVLGLTP